MLVKFLIWKGLQLNRLSVISTFFNVPSTRHNLSWWECWPTPSPGGWIIIKPLIISVLYLCMSVMDQNNISWGLLELSNPWFQTKVKQYFIFQCVERCLYLCILYLYMSGLVDSLATLTLLLLFYFSHCCPTTFIQSTKNPLKVKPFWIAWVAWCTVSPVFEVTKGTLGASSLEKEHTQEKENNTSGWTSPRPTLKKA